MQRYFNVITLWLQKYYNFVTNIRFNNFVINNLLQITIFANTKLDRKIKNMAKILVVDDEQDLCEILQFNLELQDYSVDVAYSAEDAIPMLETSEYNLILLDVMMDGMSGFEMAEKLKQKDNLSQIPIVFCTAKDTEDDTLRGFGLGADDYIAKPFRISEVLARVKAVLRRSAQQNKTADIADNIDDAILYCDMLRVLTDEKRVFIGEKEITLTRKEYDILVLLMLNKGRIFSRDEILANVWPDDVYVLDRSVDVNIARLRKKLGTDYAKYIVSRSGYGYVFQS